MRHVILVKDAWVLLSTCRYILEYPLDVYVHENVSNLIYTGMNFRNTQIKGLFTQVKKSKFLHWQLKPWFKVLIV
jgi:hypothetical protein